MPKIEGVQRYVQGEGQCAFASVATVANYYNNKYNFNDIVSLYPNSGLGLLSPEVGILLNKLGFNSVEIYTADTEIFDFSWQRSSRSKLIKNLKYNSRYNSDQGCREISRYYWKYLENSINNKLFITSSFGKVIRESIDVSIPVLASFNWNMFFEFPKCNEYGKYDALKGDVEYHQVVINGYDDKHVYIVDSNKELYKGKLRKYSNGKYEAEWDRFMTCMGTGDLIIVRDELV